MPFKFTAPDGQSVIDRALVAWKGQGKLSVAVLLDEDNSGNAAASMFELAIAAGGTTAMAKAERAELWYFLGDAVVVTEAAMEPKRTVSGRRHDGCSGGPRARGRRCAGRGRMRWWSSCRA